MTRAGFCQHLDDVFAHMARMLRQFFIFHMNYSPIVNIIVAVYIILPSNGCQG